VAVAQSEQHIARDTAGRRGDEPQSAARILDAAERCFRDEGFAGASVRQVADLAGVSKSLVLYHFRCKEQLYVEVQLRIFRRLAEAVQAVAAVRGGTPLERAMLGLDALLAALRDNGDLAAHAVLGVRALSSPRLRHHIDRMRSDLHELVLATIERLLGDDQHLPMELAAAADVLSAALTGVGLQAALGDPPERVERTLDGLRALIGAALERGGPSRGSE
jgi:AcrR family transcriptional regulator